MKKLPANVIIEHETYGIKRIKYTFSEGEIMKCLIKEHNIPLPLYKEGTTHSFDIIEEYEGERAKAVLIVNYKQKEQKEDGE